MIRDHSWNMISSFLFILMTIFLVVTGGETLAQSRGGVEEFYKGATIKFIVPNAPGGSFDLWARALAPRFEKYAGSKVIVENMMGAGGIVSGNYLCHLAKPDGLTIGILSVPGMVVSKILDLPEAKYEMENFTYIGRVAVEDRVLFASKASGFKTIADMQKANKTIRFGTTNPTSISSVQESLLIEAFGLKARIISGYKGSR